MTRFFRMITVVSLVIGAGMPAGAVDDGRVPLVTVRFNQARVYFDQQLYGAVAKAVSAKPEVMFDVVAYAPSTGNVEADKRWQSVSGRNTRAVVKAMTDMGVPMSRMNVVGQSQTGLKFDETRVYVR